LEDYSVTIREAVTTHQTHCSKVFTDDELYDCPVHVWYFRPTYGTRTARSYGSLLEVTSLQCHHENLTSINSHNQFDSDTKINIL